MEENEIFGSELNSTEVETTTVDTEVQTTTEDNQETQQEEQKPFYKKGPPKHIPYDRFQAVNEEKRKAREEAEQYKRELEEVRRSTRQETATEAKEKAAPSILDYDSVQDYEKAKQEYDEERFEKKAYETYTKREREAEQVRKFNEVATSYNSRIAKAAETDPDVREADECLGQFAKHIDPRLLKKILTDEDAPEIVKYLARSEDSIRKMIEDPYETLYDIGVLKARIQPKEEARPVEEVRKAIPKTIRGGSTASHGAWDGKGGVAGLRAWEARNRKQH